MICSPILLSVFQEMLKFIDHARLVHNKFAILRFIHLPTRCTRKYIVRQKMCTWGYGNVVTLTNWLYQAPFHPVYHTKMMVNEAEYIT